MDPIFEAYIENDKLQVVNAEGFRAYLRGFNGERFDLIARKKRKSRTSSQNKYYYGVVLSLISQETGYTVDEVHLDMRRKFLKKHTDFGMEIIQSTTSLTTVEFKGYIDKIKHWALMGDKDFDGLKLYIPEPSEVNYD